MDALSSRLGNIRSQVGDLTTLIEEETNGARKRWNEEKEEHQQLIKSLTMSQDILQKEKKRLRTEVQAAAAKTGGSAKPKASAEPADVVDLQTKLISLNNRLLDTDFAMKGCNLEIAACTRKEEKELLSSQLVCLQDTRRLLAREVDELRASIFRAESSARVEAEREVAEASGTAELRRVEEQLGRIAGRIDRAKLALHLPEVKGFRFTTGGSGVYLGAHDLFLSEVSGRFEVSCEKVIKPDGSAIARLSVSLGGVSASSEWAELQAGAKRESGNGGQEGGPAPGAGTTRASTIRRTARTTSGGGEKSGGAATATPKETTATAAAAAATSSSSSSSTPAVGGVPPLPTISAPAAKSRLSGGGAPIQTPTPTPASTPMHQPLTSFLSVDSQASNASTATTTTATAAAALRHDILDTMSSAASTPTASYAAGPAVSSPARAAPAASVQQMRQRWEGGAGSSVAGTSTALPPTHPPAKVKGEMVAGFLSGLSRTRDKLRAGSGGDASSSGILSTQSSVDSGSPGGPSRLGERMDRFKDKFRDVRGTLGDKVDRARDVMGDKLADVKDSMKDSMQEGKGKLSKLARSIASKAPIMRKRGNTSGSHDGGASLARASGGVAGSSAAGSEVDGGIAEEGEEEADRLARGSNPRDSVGDGVMLGDLVLREDEYMGTAVADSAGGAADGGMQHEEEQVVTPLGAAITLGDYFSEESGDVAGTLAPAVPVAAQPGPVAEGLEGLGSDPASIFSKPTAQAAAAAAAAAAQAAAAARPPPRTASSASTSSLGGAGDGDSSNHGGSGGGAAPAEEGGEGGGMSVAFDGFEAQPSRKGMYVLVLGEQVEVVGERGTKVPDMSMRELLLEVEVVANAVVEWSELSGWQIPDARPLECSILQLEHKMRGSSLPLPRAALRGLLNLLLPSILAKVVVGSLPPELGAYVVESGESLQLAGEVRVLGHSLTTYMAELAPSGRLQDPARRAKWQAEQAAAARARALLGLTELQAQALSELLSGKHALASPPRPASVCELCRLYVTHAGSRFWGPLCGLWNKGLQAVFEHYRVPPTERFSFKALMEGPVARLVRKPVRATLTIDRLKVAVDADAALHTLRAMFERLAREYHKRAASGEVDSAAPVVPLDEQLAALDAWHIGLASALRMFKARFRSASATLLVAADAQVFQAGAEHVVYDGPLRLRVPLELATDTGDNSFSVDVSLPDRSAFMNSMTSMLQEIMQGLSGAVARQEDAADAGTAPPLRAARTSADSTGPPPPSSTSSAGTRKAEVVGREEEEGEEGEEEGDGRGERRERARGGVGTVPVPQLQNPVVGQLSARKLALSLRLDEERVAELLAAVSNTTPQPSPHASGVLPSASQLAAEGGEQPPGTPTARLSTSGAGAGAHAQLLGMLMGCYGDLFSTSLDLGWRADTSPDAAPGATRPACMLTVSNNEVTRVVATLESLMFQSCVSPQLAVRVLNAVVTGLLTRWYSPDSYQVRFWHKLLAHVHEYVGKKSLDALLCLSAHAEVVKPPPPMPHPAPAKAHAGQRHGSATHHPGGKAPAHAHGSHVHGAHHTGGGSGGRAPPVVVPVGVQGSGVAAGAGAAQCAGSSKLRVVLVGDRGSNPQGLGHVAPMYIVNDVNLLTLLDSIKLLTEGG